jgi:hypothetical protein
MPKLEAAVLLRSIHFVNGNLTSRAALLGVAQNSEAAGPGLQLPASWSHIVGLGVPAAAICYLLLTYRVSHH